MAFMKIFHIDCGRKYFTPKQLKHIITRMGENGFDTIELAVGNGGTRFLLDDMEIKTPRRTYDSGDVRNAVNAGNKAYHDCGTNELTEAETDDLIRFAAANGIGVMPLLNTPGHMEAVVTAMERLGIPDVRFRGSGSTIDLNNAEAAAFTKAFVTKYAKWFADRGSRYFNLGCDEYANDVLSSGFEALCSKEDFLYDRFIAYANETAGIVKEHGMVPVMFNDGFYYGGCTDGGRLDKEIICSYWTTGWPGYTPAPARLVEGMGHKIINTAAAWYYVLGRRTGDGGNQMFTDDEAVKGSWQVGRNEVPGGADSAPAGAMLCLWCDEPGVPYTAEEEEIVGKLIGMF